MIRTGCARRNPPRSAAPAPKGSLRELPLPFKGGGIAPAKGVGYQSSVLSDQCGGGRTRPRDWLPTSFSLELYGKSLAFTLSPSYVHLEQDSLACSLDTGSGDNLSPCEHSRQGCLGYRLWRSLKYEEVYLKAYETVPEARAGIKEWIRFYNHERTHQSLGRQTPEEVYFNQSTKELAA